VGVPKTIDNDLESTAMTFGFNSAVSFATECIDRLHSTALSHQRIMVVEVMGRYAGWIALHAGLAGRADAILIPEIPYSIEKVAAHLQRKQREGKPYSIVVVAEGAKPIGGDVTVKSREIGRVERLGGVGETITTQLQELTHKESRCVVLGHLLRGGSPTALDRNLGVTFGAGAVYALSKGLNGVMVALKPPRLEFVPILEAIAKLKLVPSDGEGVLVARVLDMSFGDR
jgi:6-phosphofructokinase 1